MSTLEAPYWREQEAGLYVDGRKLTIVRLATDLEDAHVPDCIEVARDQLLPLEPHIIERNHALPEDAEQLQVAAKQYRIVTPGEASRPVHVRASQRGGSFLVLNALFAAPDCLVSYSSAQRSAELSGVLPGFRSPKSVHHPLFRTRKNTSNHIYVGLRRDFRLADERPAVRPATVSAATAETSAPFSSSAPYGSVLFEGRELNQKGSFLRVLNLEHVNRQTDKLMAKMPAGTPCNELVILDNGHAEINGAPYPAGPYTINFLNRLLARYQGEPVTLAKLLGTKNKDLLKPAEELARRLRVAGMVVYQEIDGQKVIFLRPTKITDKRPR